MSDRSSGSGSWLPRRRRLADGRLEVALRPQPEAVSALQLRDVHGHCHVRNLHVAAARLRRLAVVIRLVVARLVLVLRLVALVLLAVVVARLVPTSAAVPTT